MSQRRRQVGLLGESAARTYLQNSGFIIIQSNYRCFLGEIDIIAREKGAVIFVEVRTRTGPAYGSPAESITADKARRLKWLAMYYMQSVYKREMLSRIDLIAVMLNKEDLSLLSIDHYRGIAAG